jgi:hypothetical protein
MLDTATTANALLLQLPLQAARAAVVGRREGDTTAAASVQQLQRLSRVKVAIHPDVVPKGNTDWRRCLSAGGAWILTASGAGEVSVFMHDTLEHQIGLLSYCQQVQCQSLIYHSIAGCARAVWCACSIAASK